MFAAASAVFSARVSPVVDVMKDVSSGESDDVIIVAVTQGHRARRTRRTVRPPPSPTDVIVIEDDPAPCPSHCEMNMRLGSLEYSGCSPAKKPKLCVGSAEPTSRPHATSSRSPNSCSANHSTCNSSPAVSHRREHSFYPGTAHRGTHYHSPAASRHESHTHNHSPAASRHESHTHNRSPSVSRHESHTHNRSHYRSPSVSRHESHTHNRSHYHSPAASRHESHNHSHYHSPAASRHESHTHNHSPAASRHESHTHNRSHYHSPAASRYESHTHNHSPSVSHRENHTHSPSVSRHESHTYNNSHDHSPSVSRHESHAHNHSPSVSHRKNHTLSPVMSHDGSHTHNHSPAVSSRESHAHNHSPGVSSRESHTHNHSPGVSSHKSHTHNHTPAESSRESHTYNHTPAESSRESHTYNLSPAVSSHESHTHNHSPAVSSRESHAQNVSPAVSSHESHAHNHSPAVSPHKSPPGVASSSQTLTPCYRRNSSQQSRKPLRLCRTSDSPSFSANSPRNIPAPRTLFSGATACSPGTLPLADTLTDSHPPPSPPIPHQSSDDSSEAPLFNSPPHTLTLQQAHSEESSASDNAREGSSRSREPVPTASVKLDPPSCSLPCGPAPTLQQYGRAGGMYLETYVDTVGQVEGGRNYLGLLEKLLSHGSYIPSSRLKKVLTTVLRLRSSDSVRQACRVLHQDLCIRRETDVPDSCVWHLLESCMKTLQWEKGAVSLTTAKVVLNYLFGLLVKDFNSKTDNPKSSLIEKVLSLGRQWQRVAKVLDCLFSLQEQGTPSDPGEVVPSLVCLPLLTCTQLERRDQATRLARELSERLGKLSSVETRKQLLLSLPSHYLRELVLDLHLAAHCALSPTASQDCPGNRDLSIAVIGCVHMKRGPYHHDGRQHDDPGYFLFQLCHLLQSHVCNLEGAALLSFLVPSDPGSPLPPHWLACSPCPPLELRKSLSDLRQQVEALTERLMQDPALLASLTDGENWLYLQLLRALTTPPLDF